MIIVYEFQKFAHVGVIELIELLDQGVLKFFWE